ATAAGGAPVAGLGGRMDRAAARSPGADQAPGAGDGGRRGQCRLQGHPVRRAAGCPPAMNRGAMNDVLPASAISPADATVALTEALIARPSLTPDDAGCQDMIAQRLSAAGFHIHRLRFGEVDNLLAVFGDAGPGLMFL